MNEKKHFEVERAANITKLGRSRTLKKLGLDFSTQTAKYKYTYNFSWLGRPIIQFPQDILAMQELIWTVQPEYIVETGIAHGGSLIFYASMLELLGGRGKVIGVDIDIRAHNRKEIEKHRMSKRIKMIQGSSIDNKLVEKVGKIVKNRRVMVVLDSNHTHKHVLEELKLYSPMVSTGSYLVVFDTLIEDRPKGTFKGTGWDKGNNPKTAVWEFLKSNKSFIIDKDIENKLLITVAPDGFLKRVR